MDQNIVNKLAVFMGQVEVLSMGHTGAIRYRYTGKYIHGVMRGGVLTLLATYKRLATWANTGLF